MSLNLPYSGSIAPHNPARQLAASFPLRVFLFFLLHIPLTFVLPLSGWLGALHALAILVFGLRAALRRRSDLVLYALAYIAGAEVFWRMADANIFWEFGKYASCLIVAVGLLAEGRQWGHKQRKNPWLLLYFILLLPAVVPTFLAYNLAHVREPLSFNLSGPLAISLISLYLWRRPMTRPQLYPLLIAFIASTIPILVRAAYFTLTRPITFTLESNFVTSGGYGPNQVSNLLGLGALTTFILFLVLKEHRNLRLLLLLLTLGFTVQSFLTFSRGGTFSFFLAAAIFGLHILRQPRVRNRFLLLVVLLYAIMTWVLLPQLDQFSEGNLVQRYSSLQTTGRLDAARADLLAFRENPITGVGIAMAHTYRAELLGRSISAHTEYTRLLAEHGLFGLFAFLLLITLLLKSYFGARPGLPRALGATFGVWSLSIMTQSAMRFVAIALALSIVFITWNVNDNAQKTASSE